MSPESGRKFENLSTPNENLRPLVPTDLDIGAMREKLTEVGLNLEISPESRLSLAKNKFRDLDSGRGTGIVAVLGREKAEKLLKWCQVKSENGPKLKGGGEETKGRGLRQLAADMIELVTKPEPTQEELERFYLRTNQRVMKGLLWEARGNEAAKKIIKEKFNGIVTPEKTLASVPPGSVAELWDYLTGDTSNLLIKFYIAKARMAAGKELGEEGFDKINGTIGDLWTDAAFNSDELIKKDPEKALELGLTICLLPENSDSETERVYKWMRGDGPLIVANDGLKTELRGYMDTNPQASELVSKMREYMKFNVAEVADEDIATEARCFLVVAAIYLGTKMQGMEDIEMANSYYKEALEKLADPEVVRVLKHYATEPDAAWIVDELEDYLPE